MAKKLLLVLFIVLSLLSRVQSEDGIHVDLLVLHSIETGSVLEWSPDGSLLAIGTNEGIRLYSDTLHFTQLLPQLVDNMCAVEWSADGQYIVGIGGGYRTGSHENNRIYVWEFDNATVQTLYGKPDDSLGNEISWSADNRLIASRNIHNEIEIWNALTGKQVRQITPPPVVSPDGYTYDNGILFLDWSRDGARLAGVVSEIRIMIWDPTTGELNLEIKNTDSDPYLASYVVQWSPDGQMLADNYRVMDANTGEIIDTFYEIQVFEDLPQPSFIDWHPDSRYLAVRHKGQIYIYDVVQKVRLGEFTVGGEPDFGCTEPKTIDWHPDGKRLASIAEDGEVSIWQVFED